MENMDCEVDMAVVADTVHMNLHILEVEVEVAGCKTLVQKTDLVDSFVDMEVAERAEEVWDSRKAQ